MKKKYVNKLPKGIEVETTEVQVKNGELTVSVYFKNSFNPKDGDFLVSAMGNVFIYSDKDAVDSNTYSSYCGIYARNNGSISTKFSNNWTEKEGCRYATSVEKSEFLRRLEKEYHKKWNPEKKCLEDIYIPKFGDIVKVIFSSTTFPRNYTICIFPNKPIPSKSFCNNFFDIGINMEGRLWYESTTGGSYKKSGISLASESEKQELFDKLAEVGKRWNPETKQLEDVRWRAKFAEQYFTIRNMYVISYKECNTTEDRELYKLGNYFRTPEAAQKVADQIKELFKNSKTE